MSNTLRAGADTATKIRRKTIGWFEDGKEALLPAIKAKNDLLENMRSAVGDEKEELRKRMKAANDLVRDRVTMAKAE